MSLLTINLIAKDEESFIRRFNENISDVLLANDVKIQVCGIDNIDFRNKHKYIQFCDIKTENEFEKFSILLKNTSSKFCVFFNEHIIISNKLIKEMSSYLKKSKKKVVTTHIKSFSYDKFDQKVLEKKVKNKQKYADFLTNVKNPLYFYRYIFDTNYLQLIKYENEWEKYFFKEKIIMSFLNDFNEIKLLEKAIVFTDEPLEKNINLYQNQFDKNWYLNYFSGFLIPYIKNHDLPLQVQKMILYNLRMRYYFNLNGRDKFVLKGNEIDEMISLTKETLQYIDDENILDSRNRKGLPKVFAFLFMKIKYNNDLTLSCKYIQKKYAYFVNEKFLGNNCIVNAITAINEIGNDIVFDCELMGDYFLKIPEKQISVMFDNTQIEIRKTEVYNIMKVFGRSLNRYFTYQFRIPKDIINNKKSIKFIAHFDGLDIDLPISYKNTSSRLIRSKASYVTFGNIMINPVKNTIVIKRKNNIQIFWKEILMTLRTLKMRGNLKNGFAGMAIRLYYWMTKYKYSSKKIWIFFDKLYKGGDNAEYLFKYCMEHAKDKDCYYVINDDAIDYKRLKGEYGDHILEYNTLRHKILVLNSEIIFATHASVLAFCGFGKSLQRCFRNLLKAKIVCIQHGLTIQSIAQYQNRLKDNTQMYFCASKYEIDNLKHPIYGYDNDELFLTGSPRYDGLINNDQRQILIAPTWRRNIVITGNAVGSSKSYNPNFKYTTYFKVYNNFINDERLLKAAKQYNYKLVFLIHPTLSSQVDDYDKNDYLTIVPAISDISYEKILTESSLMITDYSGIQFDFAYMKKPLIYYHPKELPPQYQEGVFEYDTMGFGPIIDDYDHMINELVKYMEKNCEMEDIYQRRVTDFFAYTDHSNCERIYDLVKSE